MMETENFMDEALLEEYCLGLLPVETAEKVAAAAKANASLQQKILEIELALQHIHTVQPSVFLKDTILTKLANPDAGKLEMDHLPLLNRLSEVAEWLEAVKDIQPAKDLGNLKVNFIKNTPECQLCVAWLYDTLDESEHHEDEFEESFLILEGSCECNIGGTFIKLKAGDYLDIPFNSHHTIKNTSAGLPYVKALIQRKKIAA